MMIINTNIKSIKIVPFRALHFEKRIKWRQYTRFFILFRLSYELAPILDDSDYCQGRETIYWSPIHCTLYYIVQYSIIYCKVKNIFHFICCIKIYNILKIQYYPALIIVYKNDVDVSETSVGLQDGENCSTSQISLIAWLRNHSKK